MFHLPKLAGVKYTSNRACKQFLDSFRSCPWYLQTSSLCHRARQRPRIQRMQCTSVTLQPHSNPQWWRSKHHPNCQNGTNHFTKLSRGAIFGIKTDWNSVQQLTLKTCGIPNRNPRMHTNKTRISCLLICLSIQSPHPSLKEVMITSTVENCNII